MAVLNALTLTFQSDKTAAETNVLRDLDKTQAHLVV